jgi:hypothetical protein
MVSPDYVGAVHQMRDGIMLALGVSTDFLRGDVTAAGVIVRCEVDIGSAIVSGMTVRGAFAMGGVVVGCQAAAGNVILRYTFTEEGGALAVDGMTVGGAFAVCGTIVGTRLHHLVQALQAIDYF